MTFTVQITGHSTNSASLPYDEEMAAVKAKVAALRADLEAAGCTVSFCTVNGEPIASPAPEQPVSEPLADGEFAPDDSEE